MDASDWATWARLRGRYALQSTVSDLFAVGFGVLLGWWLL